MRKAELHCHLDGVVDPALLRELAVSDEQTATRLEEAYPITSLERWANVYEPILGEFWCPLPERLRLVAKAQRTRWATQGVHYAELFVSRVLGAIADGEPLQEWFRALTADLTSPNGPAVGLVICLSRHRLAQQLERILMLAKAKLICGVSLAGNELACTIREQQAPLDRLRETGIGIEIHAGEIGGPDSVRDALEYGRPHRLGHGVRAFEDAKLVEDLAKAGVHLEFCPTSNLRLGIIRTIHELPVLAARAAGVEFSINTDDPGVFQCSLSSELNRVQQAFALSAADMDRIFESTVRAGFRSTGALQIVPHFA